MVYGAYHRQSGTHVSLIFILHILLYSGLLQLAEGVIVACGSHFVGANDGDACREEVLIELRDVVGCGAIYEHRTVALDASLHQFLLHGQHAVVDCSEA